MMPRTHFIIGMLFVSVLAFKFQVTLAEVLLGGFIATIIDIDHVIAFWKKHGHFKIGLSWEASVEHLDQLRTPFVHSWIGILIFGVISFLISFANLKFALLLFLAFISHMIFDHLHLKFLAEKLFKIGHYLYPITVTELLVDAFAIDCLIISLIWFGII